MTFITKSGSRWTVDLQEKTITRQGGEHHRNYVKRRFMDITDIGIGSKVAISWPKRTHTVTSNVVAINYGDEQ